MGVKQISWLCHCSEMTFLILVGMFDHAWKGELANNDLTSLMPS